MMSSGGAWEVVVDKAVLELSKYLAVTTDPFLPDSRTAQWMLTLIDKSTLRDVLVERNYGNHCGMIGCSGCCRTARRRQGDISNERVSSSAGGGGNNNNANEEQNREEEEDEEEEEWEKDAADAFRQYERYREQRTQNAVGEPSIELGATMADRFCSPACAEEFLALMTKVPSSLVYGRSDVVHAVGGLFPNMSLAALHRLAGEESTSLGNISERNIQQEGGERQQPPSYLPNSIPVHNTAVQEALSCIQAEGNTWSRDMRCAQVTESQVGQGRRMPLPLMVYDWCMTISTARTKVIFAVLCHKSSLHSHVWKDSEGLAGRNRSVYVKCVLPIRMACVQWAEQELLSLGGEELGGEDPPCVDPQLQQQRLALFATHVFSADTTAALSRLLLYDEGTLRQAWGVWQSSALLTSLQFPFALPGAFVAGGVAPHVLFLALVLLAATGLCEPAVWAEWLRQDEDGSNALDELMEALGVTAENLAACVRALVLE
ncbi:hypothetical protein BCY84_20442 [Trypanosoma cruzi cruzi]|nr:hypothetical protein BCY84_20442 [Trypanosoma cruzi cruzi]